jgi:Ran GTPase-activating protein (RanGAP) involved in mRNA processing and transport
MSEFLSHRSTPFDRFLRGPTGLVDILHSFGSQVSLTSLSLARNERIGPSFSFDNLASPLFPNLTTLDLSHCGLNAESCLSLLKAMSADSDETMMSQRERVTINLDSNDLSDSEFFHQMMVLVWNSSLISELYISKCQIGDNGIAQLVEACLNGTNSLSNPCVQVVDVSHNNLTAIGLRNFACRLMEVGRQYSCFSKLHTLRLSGNTLDSVSCKHLASAITQGPLRSLHELDVAGTSCGVLGAMSLIECNISESDRSCLKSLNLFGNCLGTEGFLKLSTTLEGGHPSLETLDLGGNMATEAGAVALLQALLKRNERENTLHTLVLGGNQGGESVEHIMKEIKLIYPRLDVARDTPGKQCNNNPCNRWMS